MALLLTTTEVATLLQVHPKHVYRLIRRGLPAKRVGGEWRFDRDDVLAWVGPSTTREPAIPAARAGAPPALLAANGDIAVELLLDEVNRVGPPRLGFVRADRERALALLERDEVLLAGCHGRGFPCALGSTRLARIHLVVREVGLVARSGRPVPELADLGKQVFAYRPPTAAIVVHLERAAARKKLDLRRVLRRAVVFESHLDVATAVASGRAEAGLTTHAWAHRLGLEFRALATESYGLLVRATALGDPLVVRLCEAAQGKPLRATLAGVPGYDITGVGTIRYDVDELDSQTG